MRIKIQKWGNSLGLRIPRALAEQAGVRAGSEVRLVVRGGQLIVTSTRSKYRLADLLAETSACNLHDECGTGRPVGRETW